MIEAGQMVRFIPEFNKNAGERIAERKHREIGGQVIYVNHLHKWFLVEYDCRGKKLRESFKFCEIGKGVTVRGCG